MIKCEILQELSKSDTEPHSEQMLLEKLSQETWSVQGGDKPSICKIKALSMKYNKAKHNKTRYACTAEVMVCHFRD